MTLRSLPNAAQKSLAVLLLVFVLLALWLFVVSPVVAAYDHQSRSISQSEDLLLQLKGAVARLEPLKARRAELESAAATAAIYHRADTIEKLSAALQKLVRTLAIGNGTQVRSFRTIPGPSEGATSSLSLRVSLVIELSALVRFLYALESLEPRLFIDYIEIRATPGSNAIRAVQTVPRVVGPTVTVDLRITALAELAS